MSSSGTIPQRLAPLAGASNFRDLGGYETSDGRRVKWRRLYRSSSLAALTDRDVEYVAALGIRLVCDLRRDEERQEAPSRLPQAEAPEVVPLSVGPNRNDSKLYQYLWRGEATEEEMRSVMREIYRDFAIRFAPQFGEFLRRAARSEHLPLLVHCTAGKDRTGFAAALVLEALGVPREAIIEDYTLSNRVLKRDLSERFRNLKSPELFHTMMSADPDYLLAAYRAMEEDFGGFDAYLRNGLGISDRTRGELCRLLLE